MKIHVFVKQRDLDIIEDLNTSLEKAIFAENLPSRLAKENLEFDSALVMYSNGNSTQVNTLKQLIYELGKYGL